MRHRRSVRFIVFDMKRPQLVFEHALQDLIFILLPLHRQVFQRLLFSLAPLSSRLASSYAGVSAGSAAVSEPFQVPLLELLALLANVF